MTTIWPWLQWQFCNEPVELVAVAALVLGLPALVAWGVWLERKGRV
jgi:hypothetical protein